MRTTLFGNLSCSKYFLYIHITTQFLFVFGRCRQSVFSFPWNLCVIILENRYSKQNKLRPVFEFKNRDIAEIAFRALNKTEIIENRRPISYSKPKYFNTFSSPRIPARILYTFFSIRSKWSRTLQHINCTFSIFETSCVRD